MPSHSEARHPVVKENITAPRLLSPCTVADLAECVGALSGNDWAMTKAALLMGPSWVLRHASGAAIACGGFAPLLEPGTAESWFAVSRHGWARQHLRRVVRSIALTLPQSGYSAIRAVTITPAGARIAAMAGFERFDTAGSVEVWIWLARSNCLASGEKTKAPR